MLAFKIICDDTYSNKLWYIVGWEMFTLLSWKINQMIASNVQAYLKWQLNVQHSIFNAQLRCYTNFKLTCPETPLHCPLLLQPSSLSWATLSLMPFIACGCTHPWHSPCCTFFNTSRPVSPLLRDPLAINYLSHIYLPCTLIQSHRY